MGAVAGNSPATERAFDRLIELVQMDEIDVPDHCDLVPSDISGFDGAMEKAFREEKAVLVVYPDGSEQLIEPKEVEAAAAQRR